MPRRVVSFKPTAECEVQLAELMGRWKCDRTAAIVRAVGVAHKALVIGTTTGVAEPKVLPKDPKEVVSETVVYEAAVKDFVKVTAKDVVPVHIEDTRTQQERMDDFYRANMAAKGGKK